MPFNELKYRALVGLFDIAGQVVSSQLTKPSYDEHEKLTSEYFNQLRSIAKKDEERAAKEKKKIEYKPPPAEPEPEEQTSKDMTPKNIKEGTVCVACSRDHFSTASAALSEAMRFAREKGMQDIEVMKRLGTALDELNIMERIDLAPENIVLLKGQEKNLAEWGLSKSRDLRHKITAIQDPENLEKIAAEAANIRTKFLSKLWQVSTTDGSVEKLCKGLKDEERERCISVINNVLKKK